jgi:SAM-dependent methyltransferase
MASTELNPADELAPLKDIQKFIWSQGDYVEISKENLPAAEALVDALQIGPGVSLLDVAAGHGNVAICAAHRGAEVAAIDITPQMVELGRARCAEEGVAVKFFEGDAEDLPFVTGSFDRASSSFGAMFAPRPDRAASELFRVVRPNGLVGLTAWTPDSFIGRWAATIASFMPRTQVDLPPPTAWGVEDVVRERFAPHAGEITVEQRSVSSTGSSAEELIGFHERCNGPLISARALLRERYPELREALLTVIDESNVSDHGVEVQSGYLLVIARAQR